jgi:hypothetical protein
MLGMLEGQKEAAEVENFPEYSPHFIQVHDSLLDEKLVENTSSDLLRFFFFFFWSK